MRRSPIICALAILALGFTVGANAEITGRASEIEDMAVGMELLFLELLGVSDVEPVFRDHGDGVYSLSVPLDRLERGNDFIARASAAKDVTNLAHGHSLSEPTGSTVLVHSAAPLLDAEYNFWWVAVNLGTDDEEHKTTVSHKGPGADLKFSQDLVYTGSAVVFFFTDVIHELFGVYKSFVKIKGAANAKTKAGCVAGTGI